MQLSIPDLLKLYNESMAAGPFAVHRALKKHGERSTGFFVMFSSLNFALNGAIMSYPKDREAAFAAPPPDKAPRLHVVVDQLSVLSGDSHLAVFALSQESGVLENDVDVVHRRDLSAVYVNVVNHWYHL